MVRGGNEKLLIRFHFGAIRLGRQDWKNLIGLLLSNEAVHAKAKNLVHVEEGLPMVNTPTTLNAVYHG